MQLFCPACQAAFAGTQRCPRCGGLLLLPHETADSAAPRPRHAPPLPRQPAPARRVVVGAVFALGLYLGMRKLVMGAVLAAQQEPEVWWSSFEGLLAVSALQVLVVVFGSVVAAAGRSAGVLFGLGVGGVCGGLFFAAELVAGVPARDLVLYIQPLLLVCAGGAAGVLASRIWGAVPVLQMPVADRGKLSSSRFALRESSARIPPTAWIRVLTGAMVMLLAIAAADKLRSRVEKYSGGLLRVDSIGQGQYLTWQIAALGMLCGGALAGAGTGAGTRHGLLAGSFGAVGVLALTVYHGVPFGPVAYWLRKLSLGEVPANHPLVVVSAAGLVVGVGILGGWLGGALFLPLRPNTCGSKPRTGLD